MKRRKNNDTKKTNLFYFARYSGLAFEMLGIIVLGVLGGVKLDAIQKNEFPLYIILLSLFGVFLALYLVIKGVIRDDKKN